MFALALVYNTLCAQIAPESPDFQIELINMLVYLNWLKGHHNKIVNYYFIIKQKIYITPTLLYWGQFYDICVHFTSFALGLHWFAIIWGN